MTLSVPGTMGPETAEGSHNTTSDHGPGDALGLNVDEQAAMGIVPARSARRTKMPVAALPSSAACHRCRPRPSRGHASPTDVTGRQARHVVVRPPGRATTC